MTTRIESVDGLKARGYIKHLTLSQEDTWAMGYCFDMSTAIWVGLIDEQLACIWGLIPPTLMSNQAYLWLYTTDVIKEHQFILIRHSQLVMEEILKRYKSVCGHVFVGQGDSKSIRWLKWLGAKFGDPDGKNVPFRITRRG
jgi:hypothetical protein